MLAQVKKFLPFGVLLGYALVYMNKGWDRVLVDLKGITIEKLMARWQYLAVAAIAGAGIYFLKHLKLPQPIKLLLLAVLWVLIGYNVAMAIDPPEGNTPTSYRYTGNEKNPYALGRS